MSGNSGYVKRNGIKKAKEVAKNFHEMGLDVENPSKLQESDCNIVVIANTYERSRKELYRELSGKYPTKQICVIDEQLILSIQTRKAFGLV